MGIVSLFVRLTRPIVWRIANLYDLRIQTHVRPQGQHPVVVAGGDEQARAMIPKSLYCNTRSGSINIGIGSMFGEDVKLLTGKHLSVDEAEAAGMPLHAVPPDGRAIVIGNYCYIGSGAIIIGPVEVGDHAVIGAGSVVTKSVPPRSFVAGVPARVIHQF